MYCSAVVLIDLKTNLFLSYHHSMLGQSSALVEFLSSVHLYIVTSVKFILFCTYCTVMLIYQMYMLSFVEWLSPHWISLVAMLSC